MKLVGWLAGACVLSAGLVAALLGSHIAAEVTFGMLGPLVMTSGTWVLTERTYKRNPEALMQLMIKAFAAKVVFFGAYVAVMLTALSLRPVPFVLSFTSYFIALHLTEGLTMRRMFAARQAHGGPRSLKGAGAP